MLAAELFEEVFFMAGLSNAWALVVTSVYLPRNPAQTHWEAKFWQLFPELYPNIDVFGLFTYFTAYDLAVDTL